MSANMKDLNKVKVTVNGRVMEISSGITILQSLLQENIHIPHLCYDIRLPKSTGNCGLCVVELGNGERDVKACQTPVQNGMVITTTSPKLEAYRKVRLEQLLSDHNADCEAPCVMTCPAHIDIQSYLAQVEKGNFDAALRVIKERNPFPVACGRVCPHTCESECRRNLVDQPVAINYVKRFVADTDMAEGKPWIPRKAEATGKKIAIVGAGPSGLTAAYYSAIKGHDVTVFERQPLPGGMMRYGIPEYRLPKAQLDREIDVMRQLGVKILTGKSLGTHLRLEDLQKNFDSVYLSIGSWRPTPMQVEGENREGVWLGINYLEQVTAGTVINLGKTVVVIGGGNTAIDCSRTALRMGAEKVILAYRRTRKEMPAEAYEVDEALHEGVQMEFLSAPVRITGKDGGMQLHCMRMELGEPDRSGRRRPVPVEGSEYVIEADTIVGAIGQSTNTQFLYNDLPVNLNKYGDIEINGRTMQCSADKIFAGGDCVTGPATVIAAVAAGRNAANAMDEYLRKGFCSGAQEDYSCNRCSLEDLPRYEFEQMPRFSRAVMPSLPVEQCVKDFSEVETGLAEEAARAEAARCLHCGCDERSTCALRNEATAHSVVHLPHIGELPYIPIVKDHDLIIRDHNKCISCGRCVAACAEIEGPDVLNFYMKSGKMLVGTKSGLPLNKTDCVSCGQCANACPCGALDYRRDRSEVFKAINDPSKVVIGFMAPAVRSVISDHFGIPFDKASAFMAGMLRKLGFDKVFDVAFAADLTIMEETAEFLGRFTGNGGVIPQFTSCCPGWVNLIEKRYPDLIPHLSSCKSPQQMTGATVKNHYSQWAGIDRENLYTVSFMPCVAKKNEAARPEMSTNGIPDVDAVLTTTELIEMFRLARLDVDDVGFEEFDEPYRQVTGAGVLFGASGGVAEASLRLAVEKVTGEIRPDQLDFTEVRGFEGIKESTIDMNGTKVRVAVISGLHRTEPMLQKMRSGIDIGYDLVEVMACPGGCICGAGHPVPQVTNELTLRQKVLIDIDRTAEYRKSQDNPDIARLYDEFFDAPNSDKAHHLLHTYYAPQQGDSFCNGMRNKADSAFKTHVLTICTCDSCAEKGSRELLARMEGQVEDMKLSPIMQVHSIRLKENHGNGIYISLNGEVVEESSLNEKCNIYSMIHNASRAAHEAHDSPQEDHGR
jgi:formate dehydrogenase major subunit